ncbi:UNVERIFIED_CONTAM: hypothetical protein K2H54_030614 [Gekko kuhli]
MGFGLLGRALLVVYFSNKCNSFFPERLKKEKEFSDARCYKEDVVFDPETAHSRLEVYKDGKYVKDTGIVSHVSESKKRFDSHIFILAKNGFSKGKHYWEVEVGEKKNWALGVASESTCRQGIIKLSPQNGYWVVKFEDGNQYWAQESRLSVKVNEKPTKIDHILDCKLLVARTVDLFPKAPCTGLAHPLALYLQWFHFGGRFQIYTQGQSLDSQKSLHFKGLGSGHKGKLNTEESSLGEHQGSFLPYQD